MNREMKFRAWSADSCSWVPAEEVFLSLVGQVHPWNDLGIEGYTSDNVTLMQYTGLKDKNGVEIYEGDILRLTTTPPHVDVEVRWDDRFAGFTTGREEQETFSHMFGSHLCDVIGNIYENPELLK